MRSSTISKEWDVFIAYHGTFDEKHSSLQKARELYDFLHGQHNVSCFFYPENGNGVFRDTVKAASHSK